VNAVAVGSCYIVYVGSGEFPNAYYCFNLLGNMISYRPPPLKAPDLSHGDENGVPCGGGAVGLLQGREEAGLQGAASPLTEREVPSPPPCAAKNILVKAGALPSGMVSAGSPDELRSPR
jgi:hypothetical protein